MGYDNRPHHEPAVGKLRTEPQDILIVCYAKVCPHLVSLYILSAYHDDNLYAVSEFREHPEL